MPENTFQAHSVLGDMPTHLSCCHVPVLHNLLWHLYFWCQLPESVKLKIRKGIQSSVNPNWYVLSFEKALQYKWSYQCHHGFVFSKLLAHIVHNCLIVKQQQYVLNTHSFAHKTTTTIKGKISRMVVVPLLITHGPDWRPWLNHIPQIKSFKCAREHLIILSSRPDIASHGWDPIQFL